MNSIDRLRVHRILEELEEAETELNKTTPMFRLGPAAMVLTRMFRNIRKETHKLLGADHE